MNIETLQSLFDIFYQRTHIPTIVTDREYNVIFPTTSPFKSMKSLLKNISITDHEELHIINTYQFLFALFTYKENIFIIGPCQLLGASQDEAHSAQSFQHYISCESLDNFRKAAYFLYTMLTHKIIDINSIPVHYIREEISSLKTVETLEKNLLSRRYENATQDSYAMELRFLEYIKRGKKDKIDWVLSQMKKTYQVELSDDALESIKIKSISIITLLTRLAISHGVPIDTAFSLSDALIQNMKGILHYNDAIEHIRYASYEFINIMQHDTSNTSSLIHQCIEYINTHIYEKISLQDLQELTSHSAAYISSRFQKELNINFSQYVLKRKIEEASHLLLFTDYTFQEISTLLNFSSQSHFTQKFKEYKGMTPKVFRNQNFQYY